jgi:hypothetical protein
MKQTSSLFNFGHVKILTVKYLQQLLLTVANSATETVQSIWLRVSRHSSALCELDFAEILHGLHTHCSR